MHTNLFTIHYYELTERETKEKSDIYICYLMLQREPYTQQRHLLGEFNKNVECGEKVTAQHIVMRMNIGKWCDLSKVHFIRSHTMCKSRLPK